MARLPVEALRAQQIVERRRGKGALDCPRGQISRSPPAQRHPGCDIQTSQRTRPIFLNRAAQGESILLAIKRRSLAEAAIECGRQSLQRFVAKVERARTVILVCSRLSHDIDHRRT